MSRKKKLEGEEEEGEIKRRKKKCCGGTGQGLLTVQRGVMGLSGSGVQGGRAYLRWDVTEALGWRRGGCVPPLQPWNERGGVQVCFTVSDHMETRWKQHGISQVLVAQLSLSFGKLCPFFLDLRGEVRVYCDVHVAEGNVALFVGEAENGVLVV